MSRWPNLFIVGAPKAGTTSLYEYIKSVPSIYMSTIKEPMFFCTKVVPDCHYVLPIRDEKKYLALFKKGKNAKFCGEASVLYLSDPEAPYSIHKKSPNSKIFILLRDPVERAFSHFFMLHYRNQLKFKTFHEQLVHELSNNIELTLPQIRLKAGLYYDDINRYLELFGEKQIKIIIFEDFIKDPKSTVEDSLKFLGIKSDLKNFKPETHNQFTIPRFTWINALLDFKPLRPFRRYYIPESFQLFVKDKILTKSGVKPKMLEEDRQLLKKFYGDDVRKMESFLERKLPWKNFLNENSDSVI